MAKVIFTDREQKLLRLALNVGAAEGEIVNGASLLMKSLRGRGITADDLINGSAVYNYERATEKPRDQWQTRPQYEYKPPPPQPPRHPKYKPQAQRRSSRRPNVDPNFEF